MGKKSINRFHSPTGELFEGFGIFPHLSTCLGGVEKSQNPKSFSKIWLWKRQSFGVIFSEFWYFFLKKSDKNTPKVFEGQKKLKRVVLRKIWQKRKDVSTFPCDANEVENIQITK